MVGSLDARLMPLPEVVAFGTVPTPVTREQDMRYWRIRWIEAVAILVAASPLMGQETRVLVSGAPIRVTTTTGYRRSEATSPAMLWGFDSGWRTAEIRW
jgi:hypothetical protein